MVFRSQFSLRSFFTAFMCVSLVITGCGNDTRSPQPVTEQKNKTPTNEQPAPNAEQSPPLIKPAILRVRELLTLHQQAPTVVMDLLVRVKPPEGDAVLFQIHMWCPEDGRVRLRCSKLDVDFIEALVQPNGDFVLELVRSKEVVRGNLRDIHVFDKNGAISGPPFLAYLSVLVNEAKVGPVPNHGIKTADDKSVTAHDTTTGLAVSVELNADDTVASKTFFDHPDKPAVKLDYFRYKTFGVLKRPTQLQLSVPGDTSEYTVRLRELDPVPSIAPDYMRFAPSADATVISMEEFLKRLRE